MDNLILLDYDTLRIIWWLLLGVLLAAFAIMDGADLGVAMVLLRLGLCSMPWRFQVFTWP